MKKRVLILDDKESIGKILTIYLSGEYECIYFDNALKGIDWLHEGNTPELIISDIRMPEMCGDELLAYLKGNELYKNIPVLILSGEDSSTNRIKLLEDGAEDYIVKPFNPLELKVRIKKIIG